MRTGWLQSAGTWYYLGTDGAMRTGWQKVAGAWYYLDGSGAMHTGWTKVGGAWYYLDGSGAMHTGWRLSGGRWYYLGTDGAMRTGWQKVNGTWYYFDANGVMCSGWRQINGKWYHFNASGAMEADYWSGNYYLTGSGAMAANQWIGRYHFNASGLWDQAKNLKESFDARGTDDPTKTLLQTGYGLRDDEISDPAAKAAMAGTNVLEHTDFSATGRQYIDTKAPGQGGSSTQVTRYKTDAATIAQIDLALDCIDEINRLRAKDGLSPLMVTDTMMLNAVLDANVQNRYYIAADASAAAHISINYSGPRSTRVYGQNAAWGQNTVDSVIDAWYWSEKAEYLKTNYDSEAGRYYIYNDAGKKVYGWGNGVTGHYENIVRKEYQTIGVGVALIHYESTYQYGDGTTGTYNYAVPSWIIDFSDAGGSNAAQKLYTTAEYRDLIRRPLGAAAK